MTMATEAELVRAEFSLVATLSNMRLARRIAGADRVLSRTMLPRRLSCSFRKKTKISAATTTIHIGARLAQVRCSCGDPWRETEHDSTGLFDIYLIPFDLTIPYFTLLKVHTDALLHADAESLLHVNHDVVIKTPPLQNGAGPPYLANTDVDLGQTPLMVWKDAEESFLRRGAGGIQSSALVRFAAAIGSSRRGSAQFNRVVVLTPSGHAKRGLMAQAHAGGA